MQTLNRIQRYFKKKDLIPDEKSLIVRKFDARINRKWRGIPIMYRSLGCCETGVLPCADPPASVHRKVLEIAGRAAIPFSTSGEPP